MSNRRIQCISGFLNGIMYGFRGRIHIRRCSGQMATAKLIVDALLSADNTFNPEELPPNADYKKRSKFRTCRNVLKTGM
jgi:hypothetical protein